jgi:hypothetical protein
MLEPKAREGSWIVHPSWSAQDPQDVIHDLAVVVSGVAGAPVNRTQASALPLLVVQLSSVHPSRLPASQTRPRMRSLPPQQQVFFVWRTNCQLRLPWPSLATLVLLGDRSHGRRAAEIKLYARSVTIRTARGYLIPIESREFIGTYSVLSVSVSVECWALSWRGRKGNRWFHRNG